MRDAPYALFYQSQGVPWQLFVFCSGELPVAGLLVGVFLGRQVPLFYVPALPSVFCVVPGAGGSVFAGLWSSGGRILMGLRSDFSVGNSF